MRVRITACGLNIAYHISRLASQGIVLYSVVKLDNRHVQLVCSSANRAHVVQYLTDNNFFDIIVDTMGLYRVIVGCRRHWIMVAILLLVVPILCINSMFCSSIVVEGDIDCDTILDALSGIGIGVGCRLSSIDYDNVEDYLSSTLDLSYTVVEIVGNRLYVSTIDNVDSLPIDYSKPRDIVATHSGTITSISVVQGTAVATVGQYVNVGDTLISGVCTYTDGTTTPVYAIGTVKAEVSVSSSIQYTGSYTDWIYTDNSTTVVGIDIAKTSVYSSGCNYQYFDVTTSSVDMYPLDLTVNYYYYIEKIPTTVAVTFDNYLDTMKQLALQQVLQEVYFTVDNTIYSVVYNSSVTVTLLGNIVISDNTIASATED